MAIQYMRRSIQKKAKFDIMDLNCAQVSQFITLLSCRFVSLELTAHMCFSKKLMLNSSIWDFICLRPFLQCQWCSFIVFYVIWWNWWFFFFFYNIFLWFEWAACWYSKNNIYLLLHLQVAPRTFIPALFGHATEDMFIQPHHCDHIFNLYSVILDRHILCIEWCELIRIDRWLLFKGSNKFIPWTSLYVVFEDNCNQ